MIDSSTKKNSTDATIAVLAIDLIVLALPRAPQALSKKYVRTPFRGILAAGVIECAYLGVKGELSKKRAVDIFGSTLSSWAAAETGAAIGSFAGPVGTILGGAIGGALGFCGFNKFVKYSD